MKTNIVSTALEKDDFPSHLSFHQYKSILSFENEKKFNDNEEQIDELTSTMNWNTIMNDAKETYGKANTSVLSSSSTSAFSSAKNNNQKMLPYVVCHLDDSSLCGSERYEILLSIFADLSDSSDTSFSSNFIIDELPIYNHNVDHSNTKLKKEDEEKKDTVSGACYYSSLRPSLVKQVTEKNVFVTPLLSFLKLRRANFKSNEKDIIDTKTRAISVHLSPGHVSSQDTVMEYAYGLLKVISKDLSTDITTTSSCNADMIKAFSSASVTVSSNYASVFYYEILTSSQNSIITHGCYEAFTEYLANQHETVSVELVAKTVSSNDIVRWIVESSVENSKPWSDIGLNGENQILQVSDSGLDESHCYFKDATGEVPLTTDFDLTQGRIDTTKRKVINYVALSGIGDRIDHSKHGSHVVGSILGKRSDDGVNEVTGLIDGIASASKVTFFDANDNPEDDMVFLIPMDISQMFYFGKQSQAFGHNASWGSNSNGGQYSSRSKEIDQYFYESEEDDFIMFVAAGNDGSTSGAKIDDPCQSKNVICIGASNSAGDNLKTGMLGMNYIAFFSSRGPTADNRIKPDLIAPGYSVLSVNANSGSCDPSSRPQYEESKQESAGTIFLSGTSMACPIVAGSAALVRQYFQEKHDPPMDISGTLLKAVLINGAQALIGRSVAATGSSNDASSPYDKFQGFGMINLLKSLKHPDDLYDSPDIHVEDERVLRQGQVHEYEFNVCDAHEFRVTIVWRDPPNGSEGCSKCLVNDLDLEVELNGKVYIPNGGSGKDDRNNVERVVLSEDDFPSSSSNTVIVKVRAANLGFGNLQVYSMVATGCINEAELVTPTQSPTALCGPDQFELTLELFTNRKPEETSWLLEYQGSGGVIDVGRSGEYDKKLHSYVIQNCVNFGCFLFIMKDTEFDGLCCVKGMGSYFMHAGDNEILVEGNSFQDRQEIQKFCYYGTGAIEPTASPTIVCNEDEFKYELNIQTDLYPDESRWELRTPRIAGVDEGYYTEEHKLYEHEGCLDRSDCYSVYFYRFVEYSIKADDFVVADRANSYYDGSVEVFCYAGESSITPTYGIRTKTVGGIWGEKFDDIHPTWQYGRIVKMEIHTMSDIDFIAITYESGQLFSHGSVSDFGFRSYFTLDEDQYITKVSGFSDYDMDICEIEFETNDGEVYGAYGYSGYCHKKRFEFDFGDNALVYIFGRTSDWSITQLGFAHASLSQTTPSPTSQPASLPCGDDQFKYQISIVTDDQWHLERTWWKMDRIIDSVPFMTYRKQLESYSHTGCLTYDQCYELWVYDKRQDGLCCYFGSGSYKLSVGNDVVAQGNHFEDATHVFEGDNYLYINPERDPGFFVYNRHEFCYDRQPSEAPPSFAVQPTSNPTEMECREDEFEYRIQVKTDLYPREISWNFTYSNAKAEIESVERNGYWIEHYENNHRGCIPLNECYSFIIKAGSSGLCCSSGNGGYTIHTNNVVMAEGGEFRDEETKTFCYGPSYSQSPSLESSAHPSSQPISILPTSSDVCDNGSNIDSWCGYFAFEGYCSSSDWMEENCAKACSNCCMDYSDQCDYYADIGRCADTSIYENHDFTWEEWMQRSCRVSCGTCNLDFTPSPTYDDTCADYSNNDAWCGLYAFLGWCDDSDYYYWMLRNCKSACNKCCMDYGDGICDSDYYDGLCTNTSMISWYEGLSWQEYMQAICPKKCGACEIDPTPSPTVPVVCGDDELEYEIVITVARDYKTQIFWQLYYKYPEEVDGYDGNGVFDSGGGFFPPKYEYRKYGCAKYSCYDLVVDDAYLKIYDNNKGTLIAQTTEMNERLRFCYYTLQPTISPTISASPSITPPQEAIFVITLKFTTSATDLEDVIAEVLKRSLEKILFRAETSNDESQNTLIEDVKEYNSCENEICDISFKVCKGSCENELDEETLVFLLNMLYDVWTSKDLLRTTQQTAHHMSVTIFDNLIPNDSIEIEFEFGIESWPTSLPTTSPTLSALPTPPNSRNLFHVIVCILQPILQPIHDFTNFIPEVEQSSVATPTICTDKMFTLQLDIQTDNFPNKTSWELLYENGTIIESISRDTYSECDTIYSHHYCLDTSCFVFNLFDSFTFKGSYNITVGNTPLVQQDSFYWWKNSKRFCYPQCDEDGIFALQIELYTDDWPHEIYWQLAHSDNGTIIDHVDARYYTEANKLYYHRYCLIDGCYDVTFHDHIGDGICCSYGEGSFNMKINDDKVIRKGGEFEDSARKSFCHKTTEINIEESTSLFDFIGGLFDDNCCEDITITGYPTPVPSPYFSSQPSSKPSLTLSSIPSSEPSIYPTITIQPSPEPSSKPTTFCDDTEFKYEVIFTTDDYPYDTFWVLRYADTGYWIDGVSPGAYGEKNTEYVYTGCVDLNRCLKYTIDSSFYGLDYFGRSYKLKANDDIVVEVNGFNGDMRSEVFCYQPSSSPTIFACDDESQFKYEIFVTTGDYPWATSWELRYSDDGTLINSVSLYTERNTQYEHRGCVNINRCFSYVINDWIGDGFKEDGGYIIMANGDFGYEKSEEFCYY